MAQNPIPRELLLTSLSGSGSGVRRLPSTRSSGPPRRSRSIPPDARALSRGAVALRIAVFGIATAVFAWVAYRALGHLFGAELDVAPAMALGFALLMLGHFAATLHRALGYRPTPDVSWYELPPLTVIVPAHEDGALSRLAIESAIESGYPLDRLEIVAIDDGSKDDTWAHLSAIAEEYPDMVRVIRQPKERGRREALRTGIVHARGEIVVTLDPTASVEPGALESLVAPMVRDARVAAVAGRVLVREDARGVLSHLFSARFYVAFDLSRASQSRSGSVLCAPGALSAYRADAVRDVLPTWTSQTFWGRPSVHGEDRALTTLLLGAGHRSVYQRSAAVHVAAPRSVREATDMLVRWERGNLREDLVLLPLLFARDRKANRVWPTLEVLFELGQYPLGWIAATMLLVEGWAHPALLSSVALAALSLTALHNVYGLRHHQLRAFAYGIGYSVIFALSLWWVFPYAVATVRGPRPASR